MRDYHVMERSEGTFSRSLRLPFVVDPNQVHAAFKAGVLTITVPKPKEVQEKVRKIEVKKEPEATGVMLPQAEGATASDKSAKTGEQSSRPAA